MSNPSKRKGDKAELEVQGLLRDLLGVPARRALGAGRLDDVGDIHGVPDTVIQVVNYGRRDLATALRKKPLECEEQRLRAWRAQPDPHLDFYAATFVRLAGGEYRVVLTPEQWAMYWREAAA